MSSSCSSSWHHREAIFKIVNLEGWTLRGVPSKPYYFHCAAARTAVDFLGLHSILRGVWKFFSEAKVASGKTEKAEESWRTPCEPFCSACNSLAWTARMSWTVLFSVDTIFLYRSQKCSLACLLTFSVSRSSLVFVVIRLLEMWRRRYSIISLPDDHIFYCYI